MKNTIKKVVLAILVVMVAVGGFMSPAPSQAFSFSSFIELFKAKIEADQAKDERASRIDAYFAKREMPLTGFGETFVEVADAYDIDWRLLPAIAVRESSGGKHLLNKNPFGWGSCKIKFSNFDEAIEEVGKNLSGNDPDTAKYYADKTTYQILWAYNGTVIHSYPKEVIAIMGMF